SESEFRSMISYCCGMQPCSEIPPRTRIPHAVVLVDVPNRPSHLDNDVEARNFSVRLVSCINILPSSRWFKSHVQKSSRTNPSWVIPPKSIPDLPVRLTIDAPNLGGGAWFNTSTDCHPLESCHTSHWSTMS